MYTFGSKYRAKGGKVEELRGHLDEAGRRFGAIDGVMHLRVCRNDDGEGTAIACYRDAAAVEAGKEAIQEVRGSLMPFLDGSPQRTGFAHERS